VDNENLLTPSANVSPGIDGTGSGTALVAGVYFGIYINADISCAQSVQIIGSTSPHAADANKYDLLYTINKDLFSA